MWIFPVGLDYAVKVRSFAVNWSLSEKPNLKWPTLEKYCLNFQKQRDGYLMRPLMRKVNITLLIFSTFSKMGNNKAK